MKQFTTKVVLLKRLRPDVYLLGFRSPYISRNAQPGQFLHIKVDNRSTPLERKPHPGTKEFCNGTRPVGGLKNFLTGFTILRRPFSIHKISNGIIYILFRVRGRGTEILSQYKVGDTLDIIGPLGKGFSYNGQGTPDKGRILVAGGMGVAPLVFLGERLRQATGYKLQATGLVLLGAKSKKDILGEREFKKLGFKVSVATEDGSRGFKGTVTALLKNILATGYRLQATGLKILKLEACSLKLIAKIYACGPKEMFFEISKVLKNYPQVDCEISFEQFMGCGLGICCGCVIGTKGGYRKVCKDGPVFNLRTIW